MLLLPVPAWAVAISTIDCHAGGLWTTHLSFLSSSNGSLGARFFMASAQEPDEQKPLWTAANRPPDWSFVFTDLAL